MARGLGRGPEADDFSSSEFVDGEGVDRARKRGPAGVAFKRVVAIADCLGRVSADKVGDDTVDPCHQRACLERVAPGVVRLDVEIADAQFADPSRQPHGYFFVRMAPRIGWVVRRCPPQPFRREEERAIRFRLDELDQALFEQMVVDRDDPRLPVLAK